MTAGVAPRTVPTRPLGRTPRGPIGRLRGILDGDLGLFARLPGGRLLGLLVLAGALATGVAVGFARITAPDLYTESVPFLVAAVVIGCIARLPAMALWLAFVVADFAWAWQKVSARPFDWPIDVVAGRAGAAVFLWLVVVSAPGIGRLAGGVLAGERGTGLARAARSAVVAGAVSAALTFAWASYAPQVANGAMPRPTSPVLYVVQDAAPTLAGVAFIGTVLGWLLLRARGGPGGDVYRLVGPTREWSIGGLLVRAGVAGLTLLVFSSLIRETLDLVVIVGGLIGGEILALLLRLNGRLARLVAAIPYLVRVAITVALPLLVIAGGVALFWGPAAPEPPTPFFPYALAFGAGLLVVRSLLLSELPSRPAATAVPAAASAALALAGVMVAWLGMPATALADDCMGFKHCAAAILAGAAAAAALPWLAMFGLGGYAGPMRDKLNDWANNVQDEPEEIPGMKSGPHDIMQEAPSGAMPGDAPDNPWREHGPFAGGEDSY